MRSTIFAKIVFMLLVVAVVLGVAPQTVSQAQADSVSTPAADQEAKVVVDWMQLLYDRIMAEANNPPAAARLYAYAGVTAYQAVLPGMPINNSYSFQLNQLEDFPSTTSDLQYDWILTANAALAEVIEGLLGKNAETSAQIKALREKYVAERKQAGVKADVIKRSDEFGVATAVHILNWASLDQYRETRGLPYTLPTGEESLWVLTDPTKKPIEPHWEQVRPFVLSFAGDCGVQPRMPFSTEKNSTFYKQAAEVMEVGDKLTPEQKAIALYWLDNLKDTGTPAGHWVLIEAQLVDQLKLKLARTVEMFSLVNLSMADAFGTAWTVKYRTNLLRPETYIKRFIRKSWNPFIATPAFPEFPSGHSVVSSAAAETLTFMFGTFAFVDRSKTRFEMAPRSFTSFEHAAQEAAISRLYGGIHFRAGIEDGIRVGRCVSQRVTTTIDMKPVPQGE